MTSNILEFPFNRKMGGQAVTDKIFNFPTDRVIRTPIEVEADIRVKHIGKKVSIDIIIERCVELIIIALSESQVDVSREQVRQLLSLSMETLRAAAYSGLDIEHPLHESLLKIISDLEALQPPQPA